jgi:hypothetical protein
MPQTTTKTPTSPEVSSRVQGKSDRAPEDQSARSPRKERGGRREEKRREK